MPKSTQIGLRLAAGTHLPPIRNGGLLLRGRKAGEGCANGGGMNLPQVKVSRINTDLKR